MSRWMVVAFAVLPVGPALVVAPATTSPSDDASPFGDPVRLEVDGVLDAVSPDGRWVAGSGDGSVPCIWDVETLEATCAGGVARVGSQPGRASMAWSPDSRRVAFTENVFQHMYDGDIWVMDIDGAVTNLTDDGYEGGLISSDAPDDLPVDTSPAWSPDGTHLAFVRDTSDSEAATIMTVDPGGGDPLALGDSPVAGRFVVWPSIVWATDQTLLLTTNPTDSDDPGHGVWSMSAESGEATEIVTGARRTFELTDVHTAGTTALIVDPAVLGGYDYLDAILAPAVAELDLTTGDLASRPWLAAGGTGFVDGPESSEAAFREGVAGPSGPQAYSPDGSMWVGGYWAPGAATWSLVVGDVASGELVVALDLTERGLAIGSSSVQWVDGGIFAKADGGAAIWVAVDTA